MGQIEELQGRIATALDRISQGLDLQANTPVDTSEIEELKQALEVERVTAQQYEERCKALTEKLEDLQEQLAEAQGAADDNPAFPDVLEKFGSSIAKVRETNQSTRDNNKKLREANQAGINEPHLINSSMMTELSSLRAARELDRAELQAILETLEAALGGTQSAEGGM